MADDYVNHYISDDILTIRHIEKVTEKKKTFYRFRGSKFFGRKADLGHSEGWVTAEGYLSEKAWKTLEPWSNLLKKGRSSLSVRVKNLQEQKPKSFIPQTGDNAGEPVTVLKYRINTIVSIKPPDGEVVTVEE